MSLLNKVTNIVAAAIGIIEMGIPVVKESIVTASRVCGLVFFWTDFDEKIILKIILINDAIIEKFEQFKNLWLAIGR